MNRFVTVAIILLLTSGSGVYAQTAAPTPDSHPAQAQGKAKVVFYYGRPVPMHNCLEQVGIQIDGVTAHQIFQWHVWQTEVTPGVHVFSDDSHKDKGETATLSAGQTVYYELRWHRAFGLVATCNSIWIKFYEMQGNDVQKVNAMLGRVGVDETTAAPAAPELAKATSVKLSIVSTPDAADIEIDGNFMGNTPSMIELSPGDHTVAVSKKDFKPWQRKIKLAAGDIKLNAELEADGASH